MMKPYMATIIENKEIADQIYLLVIKGQLSAENETKPISGQFYYMRVEDSTDPLLRRPISIYNYDSESGSISMIYRKQGIGTTKLSQKKIGDLLDVLGPLGNGFSVDEIQPDSRILLIGGGIGIPPLYYLGKELMKKNALITSLLGFQSKKDSFAIQAFQELGEVRAASIDGSIGIKGTVLDLIKENEQWNLFYAVGPTGMMKAVQQKWRDSSVEGFISLEERMGCGIGACYGCIVQVDRSVDKRGYKKVCTDGPVFSFREVNL